MNKYHGNLNPKTIKVLKFNDEKTKVIGVEELPFNLIDWVDESIKECFTTDEILLVLYDLDLTFDDLSKYGNDIYASVNQCYRIGGVPKVYTLTSAEPTQKSGKRRGGCYYTTNYYTCKIINDNVNGNIVLKILQNKFKFLNKPCYNKTIDVVFDLKAFNTGFQEKLVDVPVQLRSFTVDQLLSLDSVTYQETQSKFKIYSDIKEFYYSQPNVDYYPCLMIDLNAFLSGDWEAIERRTKEYYSQYYGKWSNNNDKMNMLKELFELPEILELKADIISLQTNVCPMQNILIS